MKKISVLLALIFCALSTNAQVVDMNGPWEFRFDKDAVLEDVVNPEFKSNDLMTVPGCFDVMPQYLKQRGTAQYRRVVVLDKDVLDAWWRIDGMGLRAEFYVDGRKVGDSSLPYSSMEFSTGALKAGRHVFTAALDNRFDPERMKMFYPNYDFYAFGGFYHGMSLLLQTEKTQLHRVLVRTRDYASGSVELELLFHGQAAPDRFTAMVSFDGAPATKIQFNDCKATVNVPDPTLWSPESPAMHNVRVSALGSSAEADFGIRCIEARNSRIYLNGIEIYLRGVNRHESHPTFGSATPEALMMLDLQNLKSLGGNFIRGAHYPQSQKFLDLCDRMGVMVWEESLGWGNEVNQLTDPEFGRLQKDQMALTVRNSFNHPSVIIFAFMNEFRSETPEGKALADQLIDIIRDQDCGRLVSYANCRGVKDIASERVDIVSLNIYPGWIGTEPGTQEQLVGRIGNQVNTLVDAFRQRYPDKPIIFSEMGTCGVYGYRDPAAAQWTEEFQAEYVGDVLDAVMGNKETSGIAIWQFNDAPSYHRDGATVRTKPFALNLAGLYDQYRHPKLVITTVKTKFQQR